MGSQVMSKVNDTFNKHLGLHLELVIIATCYLQSPKLSSWIFFLPAQMLFGEIYLKYFPELQCQSNITQVLHVQPFFSYFDSLEETPACSQTQQHGHRRSQGLLLPILKLAALWSCSILSYLGISPTHLKGYSVSCHFKVKAKQTPKTKISTKI